MNLSYSVTQYFDFSTTASCTGSPILITSVGTGCNTPKYDDIICSSASFGEYIAYSTHCSKEFMKLSAFKRNYVVKSVYTSSEQCEGQPLQATALAADDLCHLNPYGENGTAYVKTNCNGGQPIWSECSDSSCTNCDTIYYTDVPCQLAGAGTSNKVECVNAQSNNSGNNNAAGNNDDDDSSMDDDYDPFSISAGKPSHGIFLCYSIMTSAVLVWWTSMGAML
jgi:hypothetical protein